MQSFNKSLLCFFILCFSQTSWSKESYIEVTPTLGYRFGGEFDLEDSDNIDLKDKASFGVSLNWAFDKKRQGELLFSHYDSEFDKHDEFPLNKEDISVSYLHFGGNVPLSKVVIPLFLSGGLGVTHFSPDDSSLDNETKFSANLGLNTRIDLIDNLSLKIGSRVYFTFLDSDSKIFCDQADCTIYVSSDVWIQSEVYTGLTFKF